MFNQNVRIIHSNNGKFHWFHLRIILLPWNEWEHWDIERCDDIKLESRPKNRAFKYNLGLFGLSNHTKKPFDFFTLLNTKWRHREISADWNCDIEISEDIEVLFQTQFDSRSLIEETFWKRDVITELFGFYRRRRSISLFCCCIGT